MLPTLLQVNPRNTPSYMMGDRVDEVLVLCCLRAAGNRQRLPVSLSKEGGRPGIWYPDL
jgi:hypothetical protein